LWQEELVGMLKTKDNLVLAQKLFDMPITPYPALYEVLYFSIYNDFLYMYSIHNSMFAKKHWDFSN